MRTVAFPLFFPLAHRIKCRSVISSNISNCLLRQTPRDVWYTGTLDVRNGSPEGGESTIEQDIAQSSKKYLRLDSTMNRASMLMPSPVNRTPPILTSRHDPAI
jgi:hypothetical protein